VMNLKIRILEFRLATSFYSLFIQPNKLMIEFMEP